MTNVTTQLRNAQERKAARCLYMNCDSEVWLKASRRIEGSLDAIGRQVKFPIFLELEKR